MIVAFSLNSSLDGKKKKIDGFSERNLRDPFLNSSSEVCSSSYSKFHTFMSSPAQLEKPQSFHFVPNVGTSSQFTCKQFSQSRFDVSKTRSFVEDTDLMSREIPF